MVAIMLLSEFDILILTSWQVPDYMIHDMYSNTTNTEGVVVIVTNRTTTCKENNCQRKNHKCLNSYSISMTVHKCNILIYDYSVEILAGKFFDSSTYMYNAKVVA